MTLLCVVGIFTCFVATQGLGIEYSVSANNLEGHDPNPALVNDGDRSTCMLYNLTASKKKDRAVLNLKLKQTQHIANIIIKNRRDRDDVYWIKGMIVKFRNVTNNKFQTCNKITRTFPKEGELTVKCGARTDRIRLVNKQSHMYICELEINGSMKRVFPVQRNTIESSAMTVQTTVKPTAPLMQAISDGGYSTSMDTLLNTSSDHFDTVTTMVDTETSCRTADSPGMSTHISEELSSSPVSVYTMGSAEMTITSIQTSSSSSILTDDSAILTSYPSLISSKFENIPSYPASDSSMSEIMIYSSPESMKSETITTYSSLESMRSETITTYSSPESMKSETITTYSSLESPVSEISTSYSSSDSSMSEQMTSNSSLVTAFSDSLSQTLAVNTSVSMTSPLDTSQYATIAPDSITMSDVMTSPLDTSQYATFVPDSFTMSDVMTSPLDTSQYATFVPDSITMSALITSADIMPTTSQQSTSYPAIVNVSMTSTFGSVMTSYDTSSSAPLSPSVHMTSQLSQYSTLVESSFSDNILTSTLSSEDVVTMSLNSISQMTTSMSSPPFVSTTKGSLSTILITQTLNAESSSVMSPPLSSVISVPPSTTTPRPGTDTPTSQDHAGSNDGKVIPAVTSALAVVLVGLSVAAFIFIYRRKRKEKDDEEVRLNPVVTPNMLPVMSVVKENTDTDEDVRLADFVPSHFDVIDVNDLPSIMCETTNNSFSKDFKSFPSGMVLPREEGSKEINKNKNRYINMIAYDRSRVKLTDPDNDYINANYLDNFERQRAYIATQGPVENTVVDFWRMVWSENVGKIVMLTNLVEQHKVKCHQYWPTREKKMKVGSLVVALTKDEPYPIYNLRTFSLTDEKTKTSKHVVQFHFTVWPDHGVPDFFHFLLFHDRVVTYPTQSAGPVLVHCSAGVGRTGTFIAFDALKSRGCSAGEVDIYMYVEYMRNCRVNMVQTLDQYIFIYRILTYFFISPASMSDVEILNDEWFYHDADARNERIKEEFEILENVAPKYKDCHYSVALKEGNIKKNRNRGILAANYWRVELDTGDNEGEYINAVYVPSMSGNDDNIVTEIPVTDMQEDFWKMVYDNESNVIVLLDSPTIPQETFIPENEDEVLLFGSYEIARHSATISSNDIHKTYLSLSKEHHVDVMDILCLTVPTSWKSGTSSVPHPKLLTSLYQEVKKWHDDKGKQIVTIVCRDGCTRCGLFCAVANIVDCINIYGKVDVLNTLRQIQVRRPQLMKNEEQYRHCVESALEYTAVLEHTYVNV